MPNLILDYMIVSKYYPLYIEIVYFLAGVYFYIFSINTVGNISQYFYYSLCFSSVRISLRVTPPNWAGVRLGLWTRLVDSSDGGHVSFATSLTPVFSHTNTDADRVTPANRTYRHSPDRSIVSRCPLRDCPFRVGRSLRPDRWYSGSRSQLEIWHPEWY